MAPARAQGRGEGGLTTRQLGFKAWELGFDQWSYVQDVVCRMSTWIGGTDMGAAWGLREVTEAIYESLESYSPPPLKGMSVDI